MIWRDNDAAGLRYTETVTAKLLSVAAVVDWLDLAPLALPDKGDCVDWLAMNPDADAGDVLALVRVPPSALPTLPKSAPRVICGAAATWNLCRSIGCGRDGWRQASYI